MDWPLLAHLSPDERAVVVQAARGRRYAKGEVIFLEGDPADAMHFVESGHLLVHVTTEEGERITLNVLSTGDIVGELSLVAGPESVSRSATVTALHPSQTMALSGVAFRDLCSRHPAINQLLVNLLAQRVRELSDRLLEASRVGLDRRLYRRLLELDEVFNVSHGGSSIPLTQEQLADLVGGTRPTVNQVLGRLNDQGVIELGRGRVIIRDRAALDRKARIR